jgi:hypothetical protein
MLDLNIWMLRMRNEHERAQEAVVCDSRSGCQLVIMNIGVGMLTAPSGFFIYDTITEQDLG